MKKLSLYVFLVLMWCNVVNAGPIFLVNCKSNFWDHPFWSVFLDLQEKKGGELVRWTDGSEWRNVIYITSIKGDVVHGYSIPAMMIDEYVFNLKDNSFTRVALTGTATPEQRKRIPKTPEFKEAMRISDFIKDITHTPDKQKCERRKP